MAAAKEQAATSLRHWIFQARPDRFDLAKGLQPGKTDTWILSRFRDEVEPGHIVYFWRSGRQAGFHGWGEIAGPPQDVKESGSAKGSCSVPVTYRVRFEEPLSRDEIKRIEDPAISGSLAGLNILRAPTGTNFKVTVLEAAALNRLLETRGERPPPDPPGLEEGFLPGVSLAPLSLGRTASLIVETAFAADPVDELGGPKLADSLLRIAWHRKQRGTLEFLRAFFGAVPEFLDEEKPAAKAVPESWRDKAVTREAVEILESARLLAISSTRGEEIGVRHFLAGLLHAGSGETLSRFDSLCEVAGRSLGDFVNEFITTTARAFPDDDRRTWARSFRQAMEERLDHGLNFRPGSLDSAATAEAEAAPPGAAETAAPAATRPGFVSLGTSLKQLISDRPLGSDHLRIEAEVAALAHAFARRPAANGETEWPSIALGLFGRWGTGKSFFMTKLHEEIERLSRQGPPRYCAEIVHIEFNAWHYKEAELWASLVHHIFDSLQRRFAEREKEEQFRRLIERLDISREHRADIEEKLERKERERTELAGKIAEKESAAERRIEEQLDKVENLAGRLARNKTARDQLRKLLPQAAKDFGLDGTDLDRSLTAAGKTTEDLLALIRNTGAAAEQSQQLGRVLLHSTVSRVLLTIVVVCLAVYFGLPLLLQSENLWAHLGEKTATAVALVSPPLYWVLKRLKAANGLLSQIGGIETMLKEDLRQEQIQKDEVLASLRIDQERVSREISQIREEETRVYQEIRDMEEQLENLGSSQSLVDFINERAQSDDYRARLGILALIRRDFDRLSYIMTGQNSSGINGTEQEDEEQATVGEANGGSAENDLPRIDRIILYIDDLDRVSNPRQVLRVMEAVHLLLSFPLFNVVVAVEEWWAAKSVLSSYRNYFSLAGTSGLPATEAKPNGEPPLSQATLLGDPRKATPREFLEKIFQVCIWVRPLGQELAERLIDGTLRLEAAPPAAGNSETAEAGEKADSSPPQPESSNEPEPAPAASSGHAPAAAKGKRPEGPPAEPDDAEQEDLPDEVDEAEADDNGIVIADSDFDIGDEELLTMHALARVVGRSPRTVKRFINTYRLLKAMMLHEMAEIAEETGADDSPTGADQIREDHVAIMTLLAIQIGQPDTAVRLFECIDQALSDDDQQSFESFLEKQSRENGGTAQDGKWRDTIETLLAVARKPDSLGLDKIVSFDRWLVPTARFGFEEWEPRSERLWH